MTSPRYTLLRADCAGSIEIGGADTLREAAELWSAAWEGRNWNRHGVMFLVTDDERDGATVDEEELQEALMTAPKCGGGCLLDAGHTTSCNAGPGWDERPEPGAFDSFLLGCVSDCVEGKR